MRGRKPKPLNVLEMSGAEKKNPQRYRARRAAEASVAAVAASAPRLDPPKAWMPHPRAAEAGALFAEGKDAYAVAADLGMTWDQAKGLRPGAPASIESELLGIWQEVVDQDLQRALNASHRILVEATCRLMYRIRRASAGIGKATSGDYAQVSKNLASMGMTPIDAPKLAAETLRFKDPGGAKPGRAAGEWGELVG
jgi:hypothetical protein